MASVGGIMLASRAGASAETKATPIPKTSARITTFIEIVIALGLLDT
jgi:hypothetical protein